MQKTLALVDDPLFCEHLAPAGHPERPERLHAARAAIARADIDLQRLDLATRYATSEELARVHAEAYLTRLGQAAGQSGYFDEDTFYSAQSVAAARAGAGAALVVTDALLDRRADYGLALTAYLPNLAYVERVDAATRRRLGDRKSTRLNSSHSLPSRMPSSA